MLQPYYDLIRLASKDSVFSTTTTWVFRMGPVVSLVTAVFAVLLIPLGTASAPVSFTGDLVLLAYLFALGRFFTVTAASTRVRHLKEWVRLGKSPSPASPSQAFFLGMLVLAKLSGSLRLVGHARNLRHVAVGCGERLTGARVAELVHGVLAENCRIPFDDPNTHLD